MRRRHLMLVLACLLSLVASSAAGQLPPNPTVVNAAVLDSMTSAIGRALSLAGQLGRAPLPPGMDTCPSCKGAVVGIIRRTSEHFVEAAAFRREMAAADAGPHTKPAGKGSNARPRRKGKTPAEPASRVYDPPADG